MRRHAVLALGLVAGTVVAVGGGRPAAATDDKDHALDWSDCEGDDLDGAQCAELVVPVDHAAPKGDELTLSVLRVPATGDDDQRIGALFVNPGGPGATARAFANEIAHDLPASVLRRFDVVGVDPRGTGRSELDCGFDVTRLFGADPVIENDDEAAALVGVNQDYVAACQAEAGDLLPHLGTRDAARDLDAVRAAMGDDQISYLGFGYGAALGQTYAQLFPRQLRAMALDGAVPLGLTGTDLAHDQAIGFESALAAFAQNCNAQPDCPASPDALGAITELMMRTQQEPVPASPRDLGVGELETGLAQPLHDRAMWHDLATAVESALLGNGTRMVKLADDHIDEANVDLYYAVSCHDVAWPGDPAELLAAGAATEAETPTSATRSPTSTCPAPSGPRRPSRSPRRPARSRRRCWWWPPPTTRPPPTSVGSTSPISWAGCCSRTRARATRWWARASPASTTPWPGTWSASSPRRPAPPASPPPSRPPARAPPRPPSRADPAAYPGAMRIAFGTDERTGVTDHIKAALAERGHDVVLVGEDIPWPDAGRGVGQAVVDGRADRGIVCCWTGTGVSMAANKVAGVRAALCTDRATAEGARRWNDANVLALGLRLTSATVADEMLDAFLTTDPDGTETDNIARVE
ncbi:MAG TPA: RpiB/LacA/LacB family sugar-phosphate isomerase [Acidimicrobiales bacterium]|nr:RpiB/LacA/LacB family sugar-phosphate isomerase [Acidimicrobiales bacterium]